MKKIALFLILMVSLIGFVGCGKVSNNKASASNAVKNSKGEASSSSANLSQSTSNQSDNKDVIVDVDNWQHPVKNVFKDNDVSIKKVEFKDNKTYPIFYVSLSRDLTSSNKVYYSNLVKQLAAANGYWDYEIIDSEKSVDIQVVCDRSNNKVKNVVYKDDPQYFANANDDNNNDKQSELATYLINNVSEVNSFVQAYKNNADVKAIVYVERYPDPNSSNKYLRDYYGMYVGEGHSDHNVNIYRFAINKDTKEILYYDTNDDKYMTLSEWRKSK